MRIQIGAGEWDGDEAVKLIDDLWRAAGTAALGLADTLRLEDALTSDPTPSEGELYSLVPYGEARYQAWCAAVNQALCLLDDNPPEVESRRYSRHEWAVRAVWASAAGASAFHFGNALLEEAQARSYLVGLQEGLEQSDRLVNLLGADAVKLEPHQRRILLMVADGLSNEEIGAAMRTPPLTKRTVKYHCATAAKVLGLSAAELRRRLRKGTV